MTATSEQRAIGSRPGTLHVRWKPVNPAADVTARDLAPVLAASRRSVAAGRQIEITVAGGFQRDRDGQRLHGPLTWALRANNLPYVVNGGALPADRPEIQAIAAIVSHLLHDRPSEDRVDQLVDALRRWALPDLDSNAVHSLLYSSDRFGTMALPAAELLESLARWCLPSLGRDPGLACDMSALRSAALNAAQPGPSGAFTLAATLRSALDNGAAPVPGSSTHVPVLVVSTP